ncbi:ATP-dependent Clp protease adapter protein ClpS [Clostridium gelidum]|uniref:ATP-dependent Clp protease adapter protein ClpS n=2 Tax=Clostridium gelidum TaxID=704125 RepID=A0ABN6IUP6_9CLOT|nr:ATP-dependent Clp protease adapter protein ClpS [Clostridium gelidum]
MDKYIMETNIVTKQKDEVKIKKPKNYKVVMYNDDYTTMEFVINILVNVFNKKLVEAEKIMIDVHKRGKGVAGIYSYDIAITKVSTAMSMAKEDGFPFKLTVEEA